MSAYIRSSNHFHFPLIIIFFLSLFSSHKTYAEIFHWPQICSDENIGELHFKNRNSTEVSVWLQKFSKTLLSESEVKINANSDLVLPLAGLNKEERYSLLKMNPQQKIEISYKCQSHFYELSSLEGGELTFKKSDLEINKILIQNLYTDNNIVQIEFLNSDFKIISVENLVLPPSGRILYSVPEAISKWTHFRISASHKSSIFNLSSLGASKPFKIIPQKTQVDPNAFYFLVESRNSSASNKTDSFLVKISDKLLVEKARELIKNPQKEKILFARIQKDHQGFNRNWSKTEKNFWSWSTTEVTSFGDLGSTACNGDPQEVEDRIDFWAEDPGQICFWNYRVKKELTAQNVEFGY